MVFLLIFKIENIMKKILMIVMLLMAISCEDIINIEDNIEKELIYKALNSSDSLSYLKINPVDLGTLKIRTVTSSYIEIENNSDTLNIEVFSLENINTTGLFSYEYQLPFIIKPGGNTSISEDIKVKFVAGIFETNTFYDTLIINRNPDFYVPIKVNVKY